MQRLSPGGRSQTGAKRRNSNLGKEALDRFGHGVVSPTSRIRTATGPDVGAMEAVLLGRLGGHAPQVLDAERLACLRTSQRPEGHTRANRPEVPKCTQVLRV